MYRRIASLLSAVVLAALVPVLPASAATSYEVHYVPTVDGAVIRVEIQRDTKFDAGKQPVILTYSPYNSIGEPRPAADATATRYNPKGYARAVADVLGTRGSTGCWDYGGAKEQQSGVDVVKFLAGKTKNTAGKTLDWSAGSVGMVGVSYNGTTANMVAARGDDVPELKAIVPIAAISRWYGYAYGNGVRYFLNSKVPTDEGFDTPLLFDAGFGDTVAADPQGAHFADTVKARAAECGAVEHTKQAYSRSPDYTDFWLERDYVKDAAKFRAATLIVHGWQDYNVKQEEATNLFEALREDDPATEDVEGVPVKMMVLSQAAHAGLPAAFLKLQDELFERYLKGVRNGFENDRDRVKTLGRSASGPDTKYRGEESYPPPGTDALTLHLGRSFDMISGIPPTPHPLIGSTGENGTLRLAPQNDGGGWAHVNPGTVSEEMTVPDPFNRGTTVNGQPVRAHGYYSLYHETEPLKKDTRIVGSAILDTWVNAAFTTGQHLTPVLVDVDKDGKGSIVERGFLNLDYRNGLTKAEPKTGYQHAKVKFLPQDYTFKAGHRIALILQGSNTVWAVPGNPGLLAYANGPVANVTPVGTHLQLPVVELEDPAELLEK